MGLGENKVPFLGHDIGLAIDGWPAIAKGFDRPVEAGQCFALEPKHGIPGVGMVGVENTFEVRAEGPALCLTGDDYRITFTESPAAQVDEGSQTQHRGTVEVKLALQSILVVRPRQSRFAYQLDPAQSTITNTGNTYFEFMVKRGCQQADSEADSKYLLPGETYHNPGINQPGNQKLIVYQSRFIPVGKDCWPD
jgi:hypothetical protein